MKTIKTRETVKSIKLLDKPVNLTKRMKDAYTRTKHQAEEMQNTQYASPVEYASENIQSNETSRRFKSRLLVYRIIILLSRQCAATAT